MKTPLYIDKKFRLVDVSRMARLLGIDRLHWPESLWISNENTGKDVDIYLVTPEVYAWTIRSCQAAKQDGKLAIKTKDRVKKLQEAVRATFSEGHMERALALIQSRKAIALPKAPPLVPGHPVDEEAQARVYYLYKGQPGNDPFPGQFRKEAQKPNEFAGIPEYVFADSYFPKHYSVSAALMVEYIEERIKKGARIPPDVLQRHKERKKFVKELEFRQTDPLHNWVPVRKMHRADIAYLLAIHRKAIDGVLTEEGEAIVRAANRKGL